MVTTSVMKKTLKLVEIGHTCAINYYCTKNHGTSVLLVVRCDIGVDCHTALSYRIDNFIDVDGLDK